MTDVEALDRFRKEVCDREPEIDPDGELDWYGLSVGFFIALGIDADNSHRLAREARYIHQYWS